MIKGSFVNYFGPRGTLAATGAGTITVGGMAFNQLWLLGVALAVVIAGALLCKFAWRRGRTSGQR